MSFKRPLPLFQHDRMLQTSRHREEEKEESRGPGGEVPGDPEQAGDAAYRGQGQEETGQAGQECLPPCGRDANGRVSGR